MKLSKQQAKIWELAGPYLKKGVRKDFLLHTKNVVKAMDIILRKEEGNRGILISAAILHDVGWAKVPLKIQNHKMNQRLRIKGEKLHLEYAPGIINKILMAVGYPSKDIRKIIEIILAHKFKNPRDLGKRLLIDADSLSDVFKDQFYSDMKVFKITAKDQYKFRLKNKFYTKTAQEIFEKELAKREKEIKKLNS